MKGGIEAEADLAICKEHRFFGTKILRKQD